MAVLAPQDWHPPRDHTMDALPSSTTTTINSSVPRQRSSPPNDQSPVSPTMSQQQPYPYPVQQQQAGWSSPHPPQQYYPAFYQNQQAYPMHGHSGHPAQQQMHAQNPYYDPANAQFAQWAYQQMMFNAQQAHQMSHVPPHMGSQRGRSTNTNSSDYFALNQMQGFNPFPSGTPPPHPAQLPGGFPTAAEHQPHQSQYQGFHPYRRPQRQGSSNQDPQQAADWRSGPQMGSFQPPYARSDAAGSSTSVNSSSSHSGSQRQRTNSTQGSITGASSGASSPSNHNHPKPGSGSNHGRGGSVTSTTSQGSSIPSQRPQPHTRTGSSSSSSSATPRPSAVSSASSTSASVVHGATLRKPSPLSQGNFTAAEKRMSRDDSDLAAMLEPIPNAPGVRSGGLKGRLRRALSLGANATLHEEDEDDSVPKSGSLAANSSLGGSSQTLTGDDGESTATVQKKKSRSLFNSRLNRSTDNISLSSTMSSASMVIRKLGNIGKLTRRNSLAGITSLFKDKKEDEEGGGKKSKKKKGEKGSAAEASVSHATAELDRSDWTASADLAGLSPAARLARQHTLKSNAEAAARAKAEAEARATAAAAHDQAGGDQTAVPATWEKNTATRQGEGAPTKLGFGRKVNEDGMRVVVEDDSDSGSDGGHFGHPGASNYSMDGWDDDEDWGEAQEDEDVTIRADFEGTALDNGEEMEPWAVNVRRSVEKARRPAKGILKTRIDGTGYEQDAFLQPNAAFARVRSNSYDSPPTHVPELGPLARIPSPDPDHIDGLHRHTSPNGSVNGRLSPSFIPPLSFEGNGHTVDSPKDSDAGSLHSSMPEKGLFSHPNSSAPALSTVFSPNPPTLSQRSATAPTKRLAFASNLSVYDTFPATVYDRRSEPATWSRLTPALAQRIKEELNSYKMEEMEVHASSRVHTQFFV